MTCIRRPYRVVLTRSEVQQTARVHVVFRQLLDAPRARTVTLFFGELSAFMSSGALAGERNHPASITQLDSPAVVSAVTATQEWTAVGLPLEAVTCILNMLEWLHHHAAPILEVQIAWDTKVLPAIATRAFFPAAWPKLGFALEIDHGRGDRFDIEIQFCEPQPAVQLDRVLHEVGVWFTAVTRGAYGDEQHPPAACHLELAGDALEVRADALVMFIDRCRTNASAFHGLANVMERVHRDLTRIARVTLA